jgi:Icc-related predicted phosphoesterase
MKLLCLTDLHSERAALERILAAEGSVDVVILGGDVTNFGTPAEAEDLVRRLQRTGAKVLAVAGNCDSEKIDQRFAELGVSLFQRGVVHEGLGFYGVSAMPPWRGTMYELSEEEIAAAMEAGRSQLKEPRLEVLVSHTPPHDTSLDRTTRGEHVGSTAVRQFIETVQPAVVVSGHIHESRGIEQLGATTVVNCGAAFRGAYAVLEADDSIRVELRTA